MTIGMMPRGRIDIGWGDLVYGALSCVLPGRRDVAERETLASWGAEDGTMVCLSIRSAFDLYLRTMAFPEGSEILVTGVTIRDMVRIIEHHGLVPVPVDVDMDALTVKPEALRQAVTPRTRAVLAAHLFGAVMPLDETASFAREHGLHLLEDCAQSFTGLGHEGHPESDLVFFSFGPIKTATALGGAVVRIRDPELKRSMAEAQARDPVQPRARFLRRTLRFMVVRALLNPILFGLFYRTCRLLGASHDDVVNHSIRGFAGPAFFANIRHRPSRPLLALLRRRLVRFDRGTIEARRRAAARAVELMPDVERPGTHAAEHSYWTFPVRVQDPDAFCAHLWSRGFDATRGKWSLYTVPAPANGSHAPAAEAEGCMRQVVYIPVVHPRMRDRDHERLAAAVGEWVGGS
jgi:perosamine synthetase